MIEKTSGIITISTDFKIAPLTEAIKLNSFFSLNKPAKWDVKNGWVHYYLKNFSLATNYFFFDFMFYNHMLYRIDFNFLDAPVENQSWETWNEADGRKKQAEYEDWLTAEVGAERGFVWGKLSAYYDPKGGGSGIMIAYA